MIPTQYLYLIGILILLSVICAYAEESDDIDFGPVTYGSIIKLKNSITGYRLHSLGIAWGGGSEQQAVTSILDEGQTGSAWTLMGANGRKVRPLGRPIKCGSKIRLLHTTTRKFLHSHHGYNAMVSGFQEVAAFGDNAVGDAGDDWIIQCNDKYWQRGSPIYLKHANTSKYLFSAQEYNFNNNNCRGCPILGQHEVACVPSQQHSGTKWVTAEGYYFPLTTTKDSTSSNKDEL